MDIYDTGLNEYMGKLSSNKGISICNFRNVLAIAKKLEFNSGNSNDKKGSYDEINSNMENDINNERTEYFCNHYGIKFNRKMKTLPLIEWICKMHKNPVKSRFVIASPKCRLKPSFKGYHCYILVIL